MTSRLNAASPLSGEMYELYAIAAALIGALIMGTLRNGLNALNVPSALEGMVVGGVLVAAVVLDRARHRADSARPPAGWRRYRKLALIVLASVVLVAAAIGFRVASAVPDQEKGLTVAFVPKALNSPFWADMQEAAEREAAIQGVRLVSLAADRETDVERQYQIIENLIQQQVDAILLGTPTRHPDRPGRRRVRRGSGTHLHRLGQLRRRSGCRSLPRSQARWYGQPRHHRGDLGARDGRSAPAGFPRRHRGPPGHATP
jgi:hypothetical protein